MALAGPTRGAQLGGAFPFIPAGGVENIGPGPGLCDVRNTSIRRAGRRSSGSGAGRGIIIVGHLAVLQLRVLQGGSSVALGGGGPRASRLVRSRVQLLWGEVNLCLSRSEGTISTVTLGSSRASSVSLPLSLGGSLPTRLGGAGLCSTSGRSSSRCSVHVGAALRVLRGARECTPLRRRLGMCEATGGAARACCARPVAAGNASRGSWWELVIGLLLGVGTRRRGLSSRPGRKGGMCKAAGGATFACCTRPVTFSEVDKFNNKIG